MQQVVLFGGFTGASVLGDTWSWRAGCWQQLSPPTAPSPRVYMAAAYFPPSGVVIAYGGQTTSNQNTESHETWIWDGSTWTKSPASGPVLGFPLLAFDGKSRLVLYGITQKGVGQTWTWDGSAWSQQQVTSPPGRNGGSMALDPGSGRVLLVGGEVNGNRDPSLATVTWLWDGASWSSPGPAHSPPPRAGAAITSFGEDKSILLVGGGNLASGGGLLSDAWVWRNGDWSQLAGFVGPRVDAAATDDGSQVLVFGGLDSQWRSDLVAWDGANWSSL